MISWFYAFYLRCIDYSSLLLKVSISVGLFRVSLMRLSVTMHSVRDCGISVGVCGFSVGHWGFSVGVERICDLLPFFLFLSSVFDVSLKANMFIQLNNKKRYIRSILWTNNEIFHFLYLVFIVFSVHKKDTISTIYLHSLYNIHIILKWSPLYSVQCTLYSYLIVEVWEEYEEGGHVRY